ncbi:YidC/Oxa1 family membrane protein insertase [Colwelliaceae bacterium 6471]
MIGEFIQSVIVVYSDLFLLLSALIGSYGLATILLSILATLLMFYPLRWAGKVSGKEVEFQSVINPQIMKIKMESQGADQHHRINELYSRYSYHPIFAIRLIMGVFIQLPFLVLTFFMFEGLDALNGESFLFLKDFGQADGLLYGGGNLLPFAMTFINLIAALFIPNFTRKNLTQAIFVSLLFFVLLYNAKSILLLFWTTNNIILLLRNIVSYRQVDKQYRFNFKKMWLKLQLNMQRKEIALFFVVLFFYSLIAKSVFIKSFNLHLTNNLFRVSLLIIIGLGLFHVVLYIKGVWHRINLINRKKGLVSQHIYKADILLVLLPLTFIVQYAVINHELLSVIDQFKFILISYVFLFCFVWLVPLILQKVFPVTGIIPLSLALAVIYLSMPTLVVLNEWYIKPDLFLIGTGFVVLFGLFGLLYRNQRKLFLALSVFFFSLSTLFTSYPIYFPTDTGSAKPTFGVKSEINYSYFIPTHSMKKKPDVYLLTYDGYVGQETMLQYGIDNSAQEQFLVNNGFKIYPKTYSIGATSLESMARVLEMSDTLHKPAVESTAGQAIVPAIFKNAGYKTYGILTPYLLNNVTNGYDVSYPKLDPNSSLGVSSILTGLIEGEFRFDVIDEMVDYSRSDWLAKKRSVFSAKTDYPKFMYTHTGPHHSQNSGVCLPNETDLFEERLVEANVEMKQDITSILASKRDAIIIINGDHGPYLTGDCTQLKKLKVYDINQLHLQDRNGSFLAIRWPDNNYQGLDNIRVLQHTFEAVFKYLFESEKVLRNSISTSTLERNETLPEGMIKGGKIMLGADKGKMLYKE